MAVPFPEAEDTGPLKPLKALIFFKRLFPNWLNWWAHGQDCVIACFSPSKNVINKNMIPTRQKLMVFAYDYPFVFPSRRRPRWSFLVYQSATKYC